MSNKPQNVVQHEHFFAPEGYHVNGDGEVPRIDACELRDGSCIVWDATNDRTVGHAPDFARACRMAESEVERLYPALPEAEQQTSGVVEKLILALLCGLIVAALARYLFGAP